MIVLLGCSTNLSAKSDCEYCNPSTGERVVQPDSVLIAYDDLRIVNSKLIELKYEKEINERLYNIISNDSIIINNYRQQHNETDKKYKKVVKQRDVAVITNALLFVITCIEIMK